MKELATSLPELALVLPNVERDAPKGLEWLNGPDGSNTLRLMGKAALQNGTTLEAEKERVQDFIESKEQLTCMLKYKEEVVGAIWVDLKEHDYLAGPSIHIMIGDKDARGNGIGKSASETVIKYLKQETDYETLYSRHLTSNAAVINMLDDTGFSILGEPYHDENGQEWQNVSLSLR